jgi:hypothetical protein
VREHKAESYTTLSASFWLAVMWAVLVVITANRGPDLTDFGAMLFAYFLGKTI